MRRANCLRIQNFDFKINNQFFAAIDFSAMKNFHYLTIHKIFLLLSFLALQFSALGQIDVRSYAQGNLFKVKPTISEDSFIADQALEKEEEQNTFIQEEINKGFQFIENKEYEDALAHFEQMNEEYNGIAYFPYVIGNIHYIQHHLADAQSSFEEVLRIDPLYMDAHYMLGMVALDSGELKSAKNHFDLLVEIDFYKAKGKYGLGLHALENYNYYKAINLFNEAIETDPTFLEPYEYVLTDELYYGRMKAARATIEKGIEAVPDWEQGILIRGIIAVLQDEDNVEILEADINTLIKMRPENFHYYSMKGFLSMELKKYHEAVEMFREALSLKTDTVSKGAYNFSSKMVKSESHLRGLNYYFDHFAITPELRSHLDKGICNMIAGETTTALKYLDSANQVEPYAATAFFEGIIYKSQYKKANEAIDAFTKAIELDSSFWSAYSYRGLEYLEMDSLEKSYNDFTQVIKLQPKAKEGYKNRAHILTYAKSYVAAYKDYSKALSIDPSDHDLYYNRGVIAYTLKQYPVAISDFQTILKEVNDGESLYMLHKCYLSTNDSLQALTFLDSASNRLKYSKDYHLELNELAMKLNKMDFRIKAFDRLVKYNPRENKYLYARGKLKYEAGLYVEAIKDLEKLAKRSPQWAEIYYLLGKCYEKTGDVKSAEKNISKARRLGYLLQN